MNGMTKSYVPKRHDIVWLDFEPKKGQEVGKYWPAFVLSSKNYNQKTGTVICCPISTSIRGSLAEVSVSNLQKKSVVVSSIIQTLSWKDRKCQFIIKAEKDVFKKVILRLLSLLGAEEILHEIFHKSVS